MPKKVLNGSGLIQYRPTTTELDIYHIMSLLPVMPYNNITELGCGDGSITVPLAKLVYRGKVSTFDTVKKRLTITRKSVKENRLTNVKVNYAEEGNCLEVGDERFDGVMSSFHLHASNRPYTLLKDSINSLKKGGWLALVDWHKDATSEQSPPVKLRIGQDKSRNIVEKLGCSFYIRHDLSDSIYMLIFRK